MIVHLFTMLCLHFLLVLSYSEFWWCLGLIVRVSFWWRPLDCNWSHQLDGTHFCLESSFSYCSQSSHLQGLVSSQNPLYSCSFYLWYRLSAVLYRCFLLHRQLLVRIFSTCSCSFCRIFLSSLSSSFYGVVYIGVDFSCVDLWGCALKSIFLGPSPFLFPFFFVPFWVGYLGFSSENFQNNLEPAYTSSYSFPVVFAIFFPAVTGIMSGANMSGDLKDSAKSIPRGTFGAVALSLFVYVALGTFFSFLFSLLFRIFLSSYFLSFPPPSSYLQEMYLSSFDSTNGLKPAYNLSRNDKPLDIDGRWSEYLYSLHFRMILNCGCSNHHGWMWWSNQVVERKLLFHARSFISNLGLHSGRILFLVCLCFGLDRYQIYFFLVCSLDHYVFSTLVLVNHHDCYENRMSLMLLFFKAVVLSLVLLLLLFSFDTFSRLFTLSLSSWLIVGAARVLQALCRDDLLPGIHFFSVGSAKGDEPRRAVALTIGLVTAFMLMGNLNSIAPLNTMCFLLTYSILNLACFVLSITGAPNFRPVFKFFNWWLALSGFVLAVVVMFVVSPIYAGIALALLLVIMILIHYRAPATGWGTISQALIYHQVRKYLLRLDRRKEHVKFWRPSLLLLVANPRQSMNLVHVCNHLKKGGLYIIGNVLLGNFRDSVW